MAKKFFSGGGSGIDVKTQSVRNCADRLSTINQNLEKDFDTVKNAIKSMDSCWNGPASSKAVSKFNEIKNNYCGSSGRKAVMNKYVAFLNTAVAVDYEATEQANTSLSDMFK